MAQVAVIGLGRFGHHVVRTLAAAGHDVLAIDIDPANVERIKEHASEAIVLDAREKERLVALGLGEFDAVVVSLGEAIEASALVAMHLKELAVKRLITKAGSVDHAKLLHLIGVDEVVFPEREAAERLAHRLGSSNILQYVPLGDTHSFEEIAPPQAFIGKTLKELDLRNQYGVQAVAVRDALRDRFVVNPGGDYRITDSDALVLLGSNEDLQRLKGI